jgi:response regulator RpfG family c-di-GMP phosphodiesterase
MEPMEKILVIDDEAAFRETTVAALRARGFAVIEAENGRAGVHLAQEHLPDLILSDVQMGSFDGFAALAAIRYQPVTSTIPVILMTGAPDEAGRRFAMEIGADDYLAKPFTINALVAVLRLQLKKRDSIKKLERSQQTSDRDQAEVAALAEASDSAGTKPNAEELSRSGKLRALPESTATPAPRHATEIQLMADSVPLAVEIFSQMLDACHPTLGNTARRAVALCRTLGSELNLPEDELNAFLWAAALSDIALVRVNQQVVRRWLRHPQNLQKEELILIHEHPEQSHRMLEAWPIFTKAGTIIRSHHEHWDGTGFPDGLKAGQIPWLAQLLAAATYYCSRYESHQSVCAELDLQSNYLFDAKAVQLVMKAAAKTKFPGGQMEILVTELRAGLVLARDLRNSSGVVLLPKGRRLTDATVARLMAINRAHPMAQSILVFS